MQHCPGEIPSPLKRYVITSHQEGDELSVGDTITWTVNGDPIAGEEIDVWIGTNDQGPATAGNSYVLTNVPAGSITLYLKQLINNVSTTFECEFNFVGEQSAFQLIKAIDFTAPNKDPLTSSDWNNADSTGEGLVFAPPNINRSSIVNNRLRIDHPTGPIQDFCTAYLLSQGPKSKIRVRQKIAYGPNWTHGQNASNNGGKGGFGLAGGNDNGVIVSGGSNSLDGFSFRPGNRGQILSLYSYYGSRPGMPSTGQVFGEDILTGVSIVPSQVYQFDVIYTLNDPNVANGSLEVYIDNVLRATRANMLYMNGALEMHRAFFCSNHGGSHIDNQPDANTYQEYFDIFYEYID